MQPQNDWDHRSQRLSLIHSFRKGPMPGYPPHPNCKPPALLPQLLMGKDIPYTCAQLWSWDNTYPSCQSEIVLFAPVRYTWFRSLISDYVLQLDHGLVRIPPTLTYMSAYAVATWVRRHLPTLSRPWLLVSVKHMFFVNFLQQFLTDIVKKYSWEIFVWFVVCFIAGDMAQVEKHGL